MPNFVRSSCGHESGSPPDADGPLRVYSCGACAHSAEIHAALPTAHGFNKAVASSRASFFFLRYGESALTRDGDTKVACVLHAHLLLLFKNIGKEDVNRTVASVTLSAQVSQSHPLPLYKLLQMHQV